MGWLTPLQRQRGQQLKLAPQMIRRGEEITAVGEELVGQEVLRLIVVEVGRFLLNEKLELHPGR